MDSINKLFDLAKQTRLNAYAPYSKFKVGAAILTSTGNFYTGCNVENNSYPCGTCAEAGAIAAMIAGGDREITHILIMADTECILPCGNCLQKIAEFGNADTIIHSADTNKIVKTQKLRDILPQAFVLKEN